MDLGWTQVIPGLWKADYRTKSAIDASSYLVALRDGGLAVVSPPPGVDESFFVGTSAFGRVDGLVAPNVGHDLGQQLWQGRFTDAVSYAPSVSVQGIMKAKKPLRPVQSLAALQDRCPENVRFVDVEGTSSGMTMFSVDAGEGGRAVFVDEVLINTPSFMGPAVFRFAFWLTGSGPGLARNRFWSGIFAKDRAAVARTVLAELDRVAPTIVLPGHGDPVRDEQVAEARRLVSTLG